MPNGNRDRTSDADDVRWQDYEELVQDIYQALGKANDANIECWGGSCEMEGPSGIFHQIDVLTRHSFGLLGSLEIGGSYRNLARARANYPAQCR